MTRRERQMKQFTKWYKHLYSIVHLNTKHQFIKKGAFIRRKKTSTFIRIMNIEDESLLLLFCFAKKKTSLKSTRIMNLL